MPENKDIDQSITAAEAELARLNVKRAELIARLKELHRTRALLAQSGVQLSLNFGSPAVTNQSSEDEKIALFKSLFKGREDVYPRRFMSVKTGQSGYSPACANEWTPEICHKPRIKCGECTN